MTDILREEIADYIRLIRNGAFTSDMIATDILQMIEKRIDEMIKLYTDSETMLGKQTLKTLQEVKEMLK